MPARDQTSNFEVFQVGMEHALDKDGIPMFVWSIGGGLLEKEIDSGMVFV
jgi:hypothetical protein